MCRTVDCSGEPSYRSIHPSSRRWSIPPTANHTPPSLIPTPSIPELQHSAAAGIGITPAAASMENLSRRQPERTDRLFRR